MSKIEWCDETDNPITVKGGGHWCRKISEGCANCYAEAINTGNRFDFASGLHYTGKPPELELNYKMLEGWARKRKPKRFYISEIEMLHGKEVAQSNPLLWVYKFEAVSP